MSGKENNENIEVKIKQLDDKYGYLPEIFLSLKTINLYA